MAREPKGETFREQDGGKFEKIDWDTVGGSTKGSRGDKTDGGRVRPDGERPSRGSQLEGGWEGEATPPHKNDRGI